MQHVLMGNEMQHVTIGIIILIGACYCIGIQIFFWKIWRGLRTKTLWTFTQAAYVSVFWPISLGVVLILSQRQQ